MIHRLQLFETVSLQSIGMQVFAVVRSQFLIGLLLRQHGVDSNQNRMAHRQDRALLAALGGDAAERRREVGVSSMRSGPPDLAQDSFQPDIARAGPAA